MTSRLPLIRYLKSLVMLTSLLALAALIIWKMPNGQAAEHVTATPVPKEIHIALRAHDGEQRSLQRWAPTAVYLSTQLPDYRFVMIPFESIAEMNEAVSRDEFDFVLTNPSSYVEYAQRHGVRHLVTLINKRQNRGYTEFGSVIFTRAGRQDINTLQDLKGKSVMGVSEQAFGGWRAAWYEMRAQGIDPYNDLAKLMFAGGKQPDVVEAVYKGTVDAGAVRTDMLEDLAAAGKIKLSDFKVIHAKQVAGFPFALSTDLYPEWPFSRMANTDDALAEQVTRALLNMTADLPAAHTGDYIGWHTPLDYQPVRNLLQDLGVGPYTGHATITLGRLLQDYGIWLALALVAVLLLTALIVRMKLLNAQLRNTEAQLQNLAMCDSLTGLANRHRLDDFLSQEWRQSARNQQELSVILFDIDHFKQYNDFYGHVAGDQCLRQVADMAADLFRRANDLVVRFGGEEFLIILLDTDADQVKRQAEELRSKVADMGIPHASSAVANHLTISIGAATCLPDAKILPERLIRAADSALYQAKKKGRNNVICTYCDRHSVSNTSHIRSVEQPHQG